MSVALHYVVVGGRAKEKGSVGVRASNLRTSFSHCKAQEQALPASNRALVTLPQLCKIPAGLPSTRKEISSSGTLFPPRPKD